MSHLKLLEPTAGSVAAAVAATAAANDSAIGLT